MVTRASAVSVIPRKLSRGLVRSERGEGSAHQSSDMSHVDINNAVSSQSASTAAPGSVSDLSHVDISALITRQAVRL